MSVSGSATKVSSEPTSFGSTTSKFLLALVACIAVLVTGAAAADAATRLVAAGGTDSGDCTVTACATVQYAIDQSVATDTVDIGPGTFTSTGNTVSTAEPDYPGCRNRYDLSSKAPRPATSCSTCRLDPMASC